MSAAFALPFFAMIALTGLIAFTTYVSLIALALSAQNAFPVITAPPTIRAVERQLPPPAQVHDDVFTYTFNVDGILHESEEDATKSPYWWLNSGAKLIIEGGVGKTVQGELAQLDRWRLNYGIHNPHDSDGGYHPQNLFRLVSRAAWKEPRIAVSFRIVKDNMSASPNRNETNGVLLMSRYADGDNLYYAGLRADGHAVIKKKQSGVYHTLAERAVFPGTYDRVRAANLLPHSEWIEIASETRQREDGTVIRLYMRKHDEGEPRLLLEAVDKKTPGVAAFPESGKIGIRTDFMDVEFGNIEVSGLHEADSN